MNKFLIYLSVFSFSLLFLQCEPNEESEVVPFTNKSKEFSVVTVENAGDIHNEMVLTYLRDMAQEAENARINGEALPWHNEEKMAKYFIEKYDVDFRSSPYYVFNKSFHPAARSAAEAGQNFNPYLVLDSYKDQISPYFYQKMKHLFNQSQANGDNPNYIATVIAHFKKGVKKDDQLGALVGLTVSSINTTIGLWGVNCYSESGYTNLLIPKHLKPYPKIKINSDLYR